MTNIVAKTDFAPTYVRWNNEVYERKACRRCRAYRGLWAPSAAKITNLQPWSQSLNPRDQRPTASTSSPRPSPTIVVFARRTQALVLCASKDTRRCAGPAELRHPASLPPTPSIWTRLALISLYCQVIIKAPFPNPPFSV